MNGINVLLWPVRRDRGVGAVSPLCIERPARRWTTKSTRNLADELTGMGHEVSHAVVAKILRGNGYSLQGTRKTLEGAQHPDRDAQFRYINGLVADFRAACDPVISVDTKKKEPAPRGALSYSW